MERDSQSSYCNEKSPSLPKVSSRRLRREGGVALLAVMILLAALAIVVIELVHSSSVQAISSKNLTDSHLSFYAEESAVIEAETFLFQDLNPPKRNKELTLTPEQILIDERQQKTDSYHDFWGKGKHQKQFGEIWVQFEISDEERKFNINALVHPKTGQIDAKRKEILERLLQLCGMKSVDVGDFINEVKDRIDADKKGKYEIKDKNGQLGMVQELLSLEYVNLPLYKGYLFPLGEVEFNEEDSEFEDEESESQISKNFSLPDGSHQQIDPGMLPEGINTGKNPFEQSTPNTPYEEWEELGIRPGLKNVLTVYGSGLININTAPLPLLEAIFDDHDVAVEIIKERKKAPFKTLEHLKMVPGAVSGLKYKDLLGFTSHFFRVDMEFRSEKKLLKKYAMMRRSGSQVHTLMRSSTL